MTIPTICVVGTGAVGRAVARAQVDGGGRVVAVLSRSPERAAALAGRVGALVAAAPDDLVGADVVVVAVADRAIPSVGARLGATAALADQIVLHTSGALAGAALGGPPLRAGSLHPLQSFPAPSTGAGAPDDEAADARLAERASGAHWFHEGAGEPESRALVAAWRGIFHSLAPGGKVLYHAAAAIVSNHTVALFDAATQLFGAAGIDPGEAQEPLAALLSGTTANLREHGAVAALTGPVARGDVATVERHLDALRTAAPHLVAAYVEMALSALDVAMRRGTLAPLDAARLRRALRA